MIKVEVNKQIDKEEQFMEIEAKQIPKKSSIQVHRLNIEGFSQTDKTDQSDSQSVVMTLEDTTIDSSLALEHIAVIYEREIPLIDSPIFLQISRGAHAISFENYLEATCQRTVLYYLCQLVQDIQNVDQNDRLLVFGNLKTFVASMRRLVQLKVIQMNTIINSDQLMTVDQALEKIERTYVTKYI